MLIGPYSFVNLKKMLERAYVKKSKKEHFQDDVDIQNVDTNFKSTQGDIAAVGASVAIIVLLAITLWIWNLVLVIKFWKQIPVVSQIFGVLGIVSGGLFCPISIILIYNTKGQIDK